MPGFREPVRRGTRVRVRAQNIKGEVFELTGDELLARAFQHEIDHLNGVLFVDRLSPAKRDILLRKLKKTFLTKKP